jgi:metal-dependent amidase/aminoacylase/carboxypeptidase family protein
VLTYCHVMTAFQAIVSRNIKPSDTPVVSVTTIQAGGAYNVIPQMPVIRGTFRRSNFLERVHVQPSKRTGATGQSASGYGPRDSRTEVGC